MDLRWFLHILRDGHLSELPLCMFGATPVPDFHLYMDASDTGLAVLHPARNEFLQVRFDAEEIHLIESGALSINVREHLCIALAVWTWGVHMAADSPSMVNHIRCWSDNTSAVAWSNRLASPCNEAQEINRAIGLGEAVFNIRMSAAHLPGATNRMADAASRAWSSSSTNLAKDLQDVLFKLQAESLAPTSTAKYSSTWKQWEAWCTIMQFSPWLSDNRVQQSFQLALFAVYCWRYGFSQSGQGNSASTILSKISHVSWNHQINLGYSVGLLPGHKLAITGMRRHDRPSARKHPMSIPMLKALHRTLNFSITQDRVLWGAAVLGFFYLLRRSEYLAHGRKVQSYAITRDDVQVLDVRGNPCSSLSSASKVVVRFRGSKNDQFGEGTTRTLERSDSAWCCPVQAAWFLIHHHAYIGARPDSLLCQVTKGQNLQVNVMVAAIKQAARSVGADPRLFGSHSLRSGGATALFNAGVDSLAIKKFGRWRSEAVERYTTIQDDITASLASATRDQQRLHIGQPPRHALGRGRRC